MFQSHLMISKHNPIMLGQRDSANAIQESLGRVKRCPGSFREDRRVWDAWSVVQGVLEKIEESGTRGALSRAF